MAKQAEPTLLKKLTIADVYGDVEAAMEQHTSETPKGETHPDDLYIMRVWGSVAKVRSVSTPYGPCSRFIGTFKASNPEGVIFQSNACYLPTFISDDIEAALIQSDGNATTFGFDLWARHAPKKAKGYEYVGKPLFQPADTLTALESALPPPVSMKALPAPVPGSDETEKKPGKKVA
jgi:hypothetical protein